MIRNKQSLFFFHHDKSEELSTYLMGMMTLSMTWMTPLSAAMSFSMMLASCTLKLPAWFENDSIKLSQ